MGTWCGMHGFRNEKGQTRWWHLRQKLASQLPLDPGLPSERLPSETSSCKPMAQERQNHTEALLVETDVPAARACRTGNSRNQWCGPCICTPGDFQWNDAEGSSGDRSGCPPAELYSLVFLEIPWVAQISLNKSHLCLTEGGSVVYNENPPWYVCISR